MKKENHPDLLDLIASYGESTNTAYTDEGYEIWREEATGWALGYVYAKAHVIAWGPYSFPSYFASTFWLRLNL
jgi:hypothetical protein